MSNQNLKPEKILVDIDSKQVQINWTDRHASVYDFTYLRRACPCAECRPWAKGVADAFEIPESVRNAIGDLKSVGDVSMIGGYAISFVWADGHRYGIYNFEYLRELCPCDQHAGKKK